MELIIPDYQELYTLSSNFAEWLNIAASSFTLIFAAEFGDKSQLVCMTLAFRHKAFPVFFGALLAFIFLNGLAVTFGAIIASWLPEYLIATVVMLLFAVFGFYALLANHQDNNDTTIQKNIHNIFFSTFVLITVAEFGDKTQLAVVALSSAALPVAVWLGATIALASTTAIGIFAGRRILQKFSIKFLHRISGIIFLIMAGYAGYSANIHFPNELLAYLKVYFPHMSF